MKHIYTKEDINPISRSQFWNIMNILVSKIKTYQEKNDLCFDLICPILRSGLIPATIIANQCNIRDIHTLQYWYISWEYTLLNNIYIQKNILICETNTVTGKTAKKAIQHIQNIYPNSYIYYATVSKVYGSPNNYIWIQNYFWWIQANESWLKTKQEESKYNICPWIWIFPREDIEKELESVNT